MAVNGVVENVGKNNGGVLGASKGRTPMPVIPEIMDGKLLRVLWTQNGSGMKGKVEAVDPANLRPYDEVIKVSGINGKRTTTRYRVGPDGDLEKVTKKNELPVHYRETDAGVYSQARPTNWYGRVTPEDTDGAIRMVPVSPKTVEQAYVKTMDVIARQQGEEQMLRVLERSDVINGNGVAGYYLRLPTQEDQNRIGKPKVKPGRSVYPDPNTVNRKIETDACV